jgi:hypothetical protein
VSEAAGPPTGAPSQTPAGWYPDPEQANTQRYWDGSQWTDQRAPGHTAVQLPRKKGLRKMSWVLIIWCALILVWAIAGGGSAANDCEGKARELNQSACEAGAGIGIAIILLIGFFGFVFLSLIWFMTRPRQA